MAGTRRTASIAAIVGGVILFGVGTARGAAGEPLILGLLNSSGSASTAVASTTSGDAFAVRQSGPSNGANALRGDARDGTGGVFTSTNNNALFATVANPNRYAIVARNAATSGGGGAAVWADGRQATALYATNDNPAVPAIEAVAGFNGLAIRGTSDTGVYGEGLGESGTGVYGVADGEEATGVLGLATSGINFSFGVWGVAQSLDGRAVVGQATATNGDNVGVIGESSSNTGTGVYAHADSAAGSATGLLAVTDSPEGWAGRFTSPFGNGVYISVPAHRAGLNVAGGTKNAVVATADGARLLYAEESTEVLFADQGFGRTVGGSVRVPIDPVFAEVANTEEAYHVFVSPYGDADLFVSERTATSFSVSVRGSSPDVEFSYRIVAERRGFEATRLERAPWADDDPALTGAFEELSGLDVGRSPNVVRRP